MVKPKYKGFFLPNRSRSGPYTNCPTEIPIKKLDRESITWEMEVSRLFAISGNDGRYMSMEKGPMAVRSPRIRMSENLFLFIQQLKGHS